MLVVLIMLGGFALRVFDTDKAPLQGDEVWSAHLAFDFGHNGHRNELGVVSSTGLNQSPFFADIFALPFALHPDAEIARIWMAALHLLGMAVLYATVRRFWSTTAAMATAAVFATMPNAVWAGRYLWNPYLALPFLSAYYATGLFLATGQRWARWLHPLMLALAVQAHPSAIANLPLSVMFYAMDYTGVLKTHAQHLTRAGRRAFLRDHMAGVILAAVSLLPWLIGVLRLRARQTSPGALLDWTSGSDWRRIFRFAIDTPMRLDVHSFGLPDATSLHLTEAEESLFRVFGEAVLLLSVALLLGGLAQAARGRRAGFATAVAGAAYLVFPLMLGVLPSDTYEFYLTLLVPAIALVLGVALVGGNRPGWLRAVGVLSIMFIVGFQLERTIDGLQAVRAFNDFTRESTLGWRDMVQLRNEAVRPGVETIYLVEGGSGDDFEQALLWEMLATKGKSRVIWGTTSTMPVPVEGATFVGYEGATHIPEIYAQPQPRLVAERLYRVVDLPPASAFSPLCAVPGPNRLNNGAMFLGYAAPDQTLPDPGSLWTVYVLWTGESSPNSRPNSETYQLFVHLVGAKDGVRYAQYDVATVSTALWRSGEQLVSRVTLPIPTDLPEDSALELRVGMYTLTDMSNATVLDADGNPVGTWITFPICSVRGDARTREQLAGVETAPGGG